MKASSTRPALRCISKPATYMDLMPPRKDAGYSSSGPNAPRRRPLISATSLLLRKRLLRVRPTDPTLRHASGELRACHPQGCCAAESHVTLAFSSLWGRGEWTRETFVSAIMLRFEQSRQSHFGFESRKFPQEKAHASTRTV